MRYVSLISIAVITLLLATPCAGGERLRVGVGAGKILIKESSKQQLHEDLYSLGLQVGWDLMTIKQTTFGLDAEGSVPISSGSTDEGGQWRLWTAGLYGSANIGQDSIYLRLKLGLIYENLRVENAATVANEDVGLSAGLAMGARPSRRIYIEIGGTVVDANLGQVHALVGWRP